MIIGVLKEIKREEYRVALSPAGAAELRKNGHTILIETGAGEGSGFPDIEFLEAGADIADRNALSKRADLIVKVKEPLPSEYSLLREGTALFTFLHLAPNRELTDTLIARRITGLAYETLEKDGALPLLAPMSEIAGRMAPMAAAQCLQRVHGGSGILPTGAVGVPPARALILGAGVVGSNAARVCAGLGMDTVIANKGMERLRTLDELFMGRVKTMPLTYQALLREIKIADIVIGAVLAPGGRTPVLITRAMLKTMKKGSVIVDVSVDQGGCVETSKPTTHDDPAYTVEGIVHYAVANMPGAYPRTSSLALTNVTLPYIKQIADMGVGRAVRGDPVIRSALNTWEGHITNKALADSLEMPYYDFTDLG